MLVFSAADFEDFSNPARDLAPSLEQELRRWCACWLSTLAVRLHATYDESINRFLNVFEAVNRRCRSTVWRWFFDHAEP